MVRRIMANNIRGMQDLNKINYSNKKDANEKDFKK